MVVRDALAEGSATLAGAGIDSAPLDASLLLAEVLNISRSSLMAAVSRPIAEESFAAFKCLIKRRLAGECVAYIVGRKEFYGLEFLVNPSVLVPRPDTETLVEAALQKLKNGNQPLRVLDLCTGSGAIAVAIKHEMPELEVWASDISAEAFETARANATRLLTAGKIHFYLGDLFNALSQASTIADNEGYHTTGQSPAPARPPSVVRLSAAKRVPKVRRGIKPAYLRYDGSSLARSCPCKHGRDLAPFVNMQDELTILTDSKQQPPFLIPHSSFQIIISNPPYIPSAAIAGLSPELRIEPILALDGGNDGLDIIKRIISQAPQFLCPGGSLMLEADPRQMDRIGALFQQAGFIDVQTYRDLSGKERVIEGGTSLKEQEVTN